MRAEDHERYIVDGILEYIRSNRRSANDIRQIYYQELSRNNYRNALMDSLVTLTINYSLLLGDINRLSREQADYEAIRIINDIHIAEFLYHDKELLDSLTESEYVSYTKHLESLENVRLSLQEYFGRLDNTNRHRTNRPRNDGYYRGDDRRINTNRHQMEDVRERMRSRPRKSHRTYSDRRSTEMENRHSAFSGEVNTPRSNQRYSEYAIPRNRIKSASAREPNVETVKETVIAAPVKEKPKKETKMKREPIKDLEPVKYVMKGEYVDSKVHQTHRLFGPIHPADHEERDPIKLETVLANAVKIQRRKLLLESKEDEEAIIVNDDGESVDISNANSLFLVKPSRGSLNSNLANIATTYDGAKEILDGQGVVGFTITDLDEDAISEKEMAMLNSALNVESWDGLVDVLNDIYEYHLTRGHYNLLNRRVTEYINEILVNRFNITQFFVESSIAVELSDLRKIIKEYTPDILEEFETSVKDVAKAIFTTHSADEEIIKENFDIAGDVRVGFTGTRTNVLMLPCYGKDFVLRSHGTRGAIHESKFPNLYNAIKQFFELSDKANIKPRRTVLATQDNSILYVLRSEYDKHRFFVSLKADGAH